VYDLSAAQKSDTAMFARFFHGMLKTASGLRRPSLKQDFYPCSYRKDIDKTIDACSKTLKNL